MPIGAVKWFDARKGFGFLQPDDLSEEILVHSSSMEEAGISLLHHGEKVRYDVEWDCGKASACNLVRVA
jgi:CspA family cold shock protein